MRAHWLALLLLALSVNSADAQTDPYGGTFDNGQLKLDLAKKADGAYAGTIQFQGKQYPATARDAGGVLTGSFTSDGAKFEFQAVLDAEGRLAFETGGTRYTLKKQQRAANPLAAPAAPATTNPIAGDQKPESTAKGEKDPLAYKVQQLPGGTIAVFENWKLVPVTADGNVLVFDSAPQGREKDFVLRTVIATPNAPDLANLFTLAPQLTQQLLMQLSPTFKRVGEQQKTTVGGDEAMIEQYEGDLLTGRATARAMYVRRNDIGIGVLGIGTEAGQKEFGRSIEIVAQSITFKESAIEPELIGTWTAETSSSTGTGIDGDKLHVNASRSITVMPNSTFTDSSHTTTSGPEISGLVGGGGRGKLIKRGNVLTFHYDDGKTWSANYEVGGGGMKLDGRLFIKQ